MNYLPSRWLFIKAFFIIRKKLLILNFRFPAKNKQDFYLSLLGYDTALIKRKSDERKLQEVSIKVILYSSFSSEHIFTEKTLTNEGDEN